MANNYAWWVGQDNNVWANVNGNVQKITNPMRSDDGNVTGWGYFSNDSINKRNGVPYDGIIKLFSSNQIADPNVPASNGTSSNGSYNNASGGGSGSSAAAEARQRAIYDRQIQDIKNNEASMQGQLDNALAGVRNEYNTYKNEQQSAYNANKNEYDTSSLQNKQNLRKNRNSITDQASEGLRGLLSVLGAMGAGGGSVARYEAPRMVTNQANAELNDAGSTYAQNQQALDTDWGNYQNQFENDRKKLEDWYNGQVKAKKQENYEKRQSLLQDLITAYANRGTDYGNNVNEAYEKIANYRNMINDLGKFTPTQYTGMTSVYKAPDLASYDTGNMNLQTQVIDAGTGANTPILAALQGLNKKKNNSPYNNTAEA